ncbi:MAG: hypothetical protein COX29_02700 [Candidatus Moranbacteria bacterium CG23_combo_of_CG06-09_8_20_14_all_35_22]|nr:MAG: hypothetical protein COX29_02700 [Candidatus Moranbacteria bacterium CG23_combo_of_CG06-09_8_20_14_all_35_22]
MITKKRILSTFIVLLGFYGIFYFFLKTPNRNLDFENYKKTITLNDNGLIFKAYTSTNSVSDFLKEKNIALKENDQIIPEPNSKIFSGINIEILRAVKIKIQVDGKTIKNYTLAKNISSVLEENNIILTRLDKISPTLSAPPPKDEEIIVTRINIEEKIEKEEIDFKTIFKEDSKLGWREKKIEQKGEKGVEEILYKITYKNGKEISRVVLEKKITQDPISQIEIQGTYMKFGKAQRGHASFYASSWGELNASRSISRGGYAKVTNLDNGKSTIVKINDYGPQSPERIIDLSYNSFKKIANLGQGIAHNIKVEEILN